MNVALTVWGSKPGQYSFNLLGGDFERTFRPNHKIGAGDFLLDRPLRGEALLDLLRRPAPTQQSLALRGGGTGNANDFIEIGFSPRFEQQRNHDDRQRPAFPAPGFNLGEPPFADARMENGLKLFARCGITENDARQFIAAEPAAAGNQVLPESRLDFVQRRPAGFDKLPRQFIGVHNLCATFVKEPGDNGFSHANAAGQTEELHPFNDNAGFFLRDENLLLPRADSQLKHA
jgi:hypothetical protein